MEFKHISDCWQYLREAESKEDLEKRMENLPRWSGDWTVEKSEDNGCLVINDYYDKSLDSYDQDSEEMDIEYLKTTEDGRMIIEDISYEWIDKERIFMNVLVEGSDGKEWTIGYVNVAKYPKEDRFQDIEADCYDKMYDVAYEYTHVKRYVLSGELE